ncbi:phage tail protein [Avibacterium paragallinarum]|uniref:Putative bacteriophage tail fiber protein n=1 Tax=Avibacterium paragallinarum TaxID=728 RepID=A0A377I893_AVIPA|nr:phage tail protein [Avibacterium paragallinarum]POY46208.1 phage tail protein [Avibacterium paragallinarum]STO71022.1 putative bacteriophage tail fiber protein [Avibacterium paragallinarum]STO71117.1 putative bacteriophage tail fiber protein [Avibacterium paragallinarum]
MAKLQYPSIIESSEKYTALADLGNKLNLTEKRQIMTSLVELLDDKWIELLAEKWSVTGYDGLFVAENNESKRQLVRNAVKLHRYKGTPWAIRDVLRQLGFGEIEIDEGLKARNYESHQGVAAIPQDERWAAYAIRLNQPITNEQSAEIRKILLSFAPARCVLAVLDYKAAPIRYNNKATYNGAYNHGSA